VNYKIDDDRCQKAQEWEKNFWDNAIQKSKSIKNLNFLKTLIKKMISDGPDLNVNYWWGKQFDDYRFVPQVLQNVIEFGCGLSTILFADNCEWVVSYETDRKWHKKLSKILTDTDLWRKVDLILWNGKSFELPRSDVVFIDGPHGGKNRKEAFCMAAESTDLILIHDAWRLYERRWKAKYFGDFEMVASGGSVSKDPLNMGAPYCEMWKKRLDKSLKV